MVDNKKIKINEIKKKKTKWTKINLKGLIQESNQKNHKQDQYKNQYQLISQWDQKKTNKLITKFEQFPFKPFNIWIDLLFKSTFLHFFVFFLDIEKMQLRQICRHWNHKISTILNLIRNCAAPDKIALMVKHQNIQAWSQNQNRKQKQIKNSQHYQEKEKNIPHSLFTMDEDHELMLELTR